MVTTEASEYEWLVILGGFVCFAMAWGIGANDVANAFATSVGARAVTLKQATIIAGIFEFAGAFLLGSEVTDTVRKGITDYEEFDGQEHILMLGMFCALCSSSLWLYLATRFSMPVSTTQSIVGSIMGFAIVANGFDAVAWDKVVEIVLFWLGSPAGSAIIAITLFVPTRNFLLRREDAYELLLKFVWPLYVWIVVFIMTLFMLFKGLKRVDYSADWGNGSWISALTGIIAAVIAYLVCVRSGALERYVEKKVAEDKKWEHQRRQIYAKFSIDGRNGPNTTGTGGTGANDTATTDTATTATTAVNVNEGNENGQAIVKEDKDVTVDNRMTTNAPATMNPPEKMHVQDHSGNVSDLADEVANGDISSGDPRPEAIAQKSHSKIGDMITKSKTQLTKGVNVDVYDDLERYELEIQANSEHFDDRVERAFNWLQVTSAALDILAHGSNDVANAVAPFAAMIALWEASSVEEEVDVPWWVAFLGAAGMVFGLATYGYKIIKAIGVRLVSMSSTRGYTIELGSALMVIIASYYGYPASTTHCQIGATVGIGCLEAQRKDSKLVWRTIVNWKLLAVVFAGWIFTVLVSAGTCAVLFAFMAYTPSLTCDLD